MAIARDFSPVEMYRIGQALKNDDGSRITEWMKREEDIMLCRRCKGFGWTAIVSWAGLSANIDCCPECRGTGRMPIISGVQDSAMEWEPDRMLSY